MVRGNVIHRLLATILLLGGAAFAAAPANLPVYIEDSHAGSFYWIAQNLSLQHDFDLVLIDAHSDASEVFESDSVRDRVQRAAGTDELDALVRQWRLNGVIQGYNWIEPLIPHPVSRVWWVPAESLSAEEIAGKHQEIKGVINAHQAVAPRRDGDLSSRYEVLDMARFLKKKIDVPVVVTIDLDYFADQESATEVRARLARIMDHVLQFPDIQAITFSVSRPYLASDDQASLLLGEALRYVAHVVNVRVRYEPFAYAGEDHSEKAKQFYRKRVPVPRFAIENVSAPVRTLILQNASRIQVGEQKELWQNLLRDWRGDQRVPRIGLWTGDHRLTGTTEFTINASQPFRIKLENLPPGHNPQVRWIVLSSRNAVYNLTDEDQGFANGAPKYIINDDVPVLAGNDLPDIDGAKLIPFFDRKTGLGTVRIYCEIKYDSETYLSSVLRISRYQGDGYVARLTEIFNLPYVYGSALLKDGANTSADTHLGGDCSAFIIYGRRREGANIPYVNPKELLAYLELIDDFKHFENGVAYGLHGPIRISPEILRKGLLLHFGKHVAAVYGNGKQGNVLTDDTPVIHQLEGVPEITTFGVMAAKYKQIRIMTFR